MPNEMDAVHLPRLPFPLHSVKPVLQARAALAPDICKKPDNPTSPMHKENGSREQYNIVKSTIIVSSVKGSG